MNLRCYLYSLTIIWTSCNFNSADDYLKQGHEAGLAGNYKAAIVLFDKALKRDPRLKEAYIQRGLCYENLKQDDKAIDDYNALLSFDPNNTTAYYYLGLCKYRHNQFEEAIAFYNRALITKGVTDPSDTSHFQIVLDLNKNGILGDKAEFDVASYEIFYERGLAYYSASQFKRAFYDFNNCIRHNYMLGQSNYMVGLCWLVADRKDEACKSFKQGVFYGDSLSMKQVLEICK